MLHPIILALAALISAPTEAAETVVVKVLSCYDGDTCRLGREILPGGIGCGSLTLTPRRSMVSAVTRPFGSDELQPSTMGAADRVG
jgi:hypothetical protein